MLDLRKVHLPDHFGLQNKAIVAMLDQLIEKAEHEKAATNDAKERASQSRRLTSFIKAKRSIEGCREKLTNGKEAMTLPGVGKGIGKRIDELLTNGFLAELQGFTPTDPRGDAIKSLCTVTGIGEARAGMLYDNHGFRTAQELYHAYKHGLIQVAKNQLTHHIVVGLDFYSDLMERMPWLEADQIVNKIKLSLRGRFESSLMVKFCGSYRRQQPTCGDLDVLVAAKTEKDADEGLLGRVVETLTKSGILVGHLTEAGKTKYMGVCKLTSDHPGRRIDIRVVPMESMGAAMLYFTGSGAFNKLMRYHANKRCFTLNEYGLYSFIGGKKGPLVPAASEEEIFAKMRMVFIPPTEREFGKA